MKTVKKQKYENGQKVKMWKWSERRKNCENGQNVETVKMQNCEHVKM